MVWKWLSIDIAVAIGLYDHCQKRLNGEVVDITTYKQCKQICDIMGQAILECNPKNWTQDSRDVVVYVPSDLIPEVKKIIKEELV